MLVVFARLLLFTNGMLFAGLGVLYIVDTENMAELMSFQLLNNAAIVELQTFYGGAELGLASLFFLCALSLRYLIFGLLLMVVIYAGTALTRTYGIIILQEFDPFILKLLSVEYAGLILSFLTLMLGRYKGEF